MDIRRILMFTLVTCTLMGTVAFSGIAFAQTSELPVQKIKPGTLRGIVSDSAGKKLEGQEIRVVNQQGKIVGKAKTNQFGTYQVKNLPPGKYILMVGEKKAAGLLVSGDATVSTLLVIMPVKQPFLTPMQWTLVGVGGVAVAVAVPLLLSGGGSSGGGVPVPISP